MFVVKRLRYVGTSRQWPAVGKSCGDLAKNDSVATVATKPRTISDTYVVMVTIMTDRIQLLRLT
jgi:hypothetical protein